VVGIFRRFVDQWSNAGAAAARVLAIAGNNARNAGPRRIDYYSHHKKRG
jgi:hypothetical protein